MAESAKDMWTTFVFDTQLSVTEESQICEEPSFLVRADQLRSSPQMSTPGEVVPTSLPNSDPNEMADVHGPTPRVCCPERPCKLPDCLYGTGLPF